MHASPLWLIWFCDHTQLCWLGYTFTVTSAESRIRSPPATQIIRSAGTPAASITRTVS
jgi:hypothetical protein